MEQKHPQILEASAVIFDVDGTLVNTVDFHAEAWQRAFAKFGFQFEVEKIRSQIGKGGDQLMPVFLKPNEIDKHGKKIDAARQELVERVYFPQVVGFPKVRELFDFLIERGIKVGLGSSAKTDDLKVYKRAAGIEDLKMTETTSEDAERSKPHPDIFNAALDRLKIDPARVMVVGDTPYDVEAATKAGMATTGLLCGGFSEASLRDAGAVDIYQDPEGLLNALKAARGVN
ncbi:HAD family phosphatase [Lichenihabitans sp. PAMC28606]|uniref:HAD family hydrolase n=1 Tax=Lichenihabitans sp. PAMC28606 TaxID=2880932 RepID=UPI001D0B4EC3|nr:HAD family phosphatase [Lichenihabitans sp. PAMC28606]UDL96569.1 HAD family phosphatase [Lichenihabitans sp. PAMC28606]